MAQISTLRQRMIVDLTIRICHRRPAILRASRGEVQSIFGRSPDQLGYEEVRAYQARSVGQRV
jgi:hypothetical protein